MVKNSLTYLCNIGWGLVGGLFLRAEGRLDVPDCTGFGATGGMIEPLV